MKAWNLGIILFALFASNLLAAEEKILFIQVEVKAEHFVEGKPKTELLSRPTLTTKSGNEATIRCSEKILTVVPGHEKLTQQQGDGGMIVSVTPHMQGDEILLAGKVRIFKQPVLQDFENKQGQTAVQEALFIQFSLKLDGSTNPVELKPITMPDGKKLLISFVAYEETPERKAKRIGEKTEKISEKEKEKRELKTLKRILANYETGLNDKDTTPLETMKNIKALIYLLENKQKGLQ